jgi:hypothetical protein
MESSAVPGQAMCYGGAEDVRPFQLKTVTVGACVRPGGPLKNLKTPCASLTLQFAARWKYPLARFWSCSTP